MSSRRTDTSEVCFRTVIGAERYINIGAGSRLLDDWTNVDQRGGRGTIRADLRLPLPFKNGAFLFAYSSHVFEHFLFADARRLTQEVFRILQPGATFRLVVPDLELICTRYAQALNRFRVGRLADSTEYEYWRLSLIDQLCRHESGGELARFAARLPREALLSVPGGVGSELLAINERAAGTCTTDKPATGARHKRHRAPRIARMLGKIPRKARRMLLTSREREALNVGLFRLSGEPHLNMYDEQSLTALLAGCGFIRIRRCAADKSVIRNWADLPLDVEEDGTPYKPSSLYVEADKPAA